jgi:hypothetical protein
MVFLLHCARAACCSARATACDASMVLATMSSYAVVQSARRAEVSERTSRLNLAGALSARFRFFPRSSGPSIGSIARASIHTSLSSTLGLDFTVYVSVPRVPRACRGIDGDRTERIERLSDAVRR